MHFERRNGIYYAIYPRYSNRNLRLKDRLEKSHDNRTEKVNSKWVITWEEFFMGLAQLEKLYTNDKDSRANSKVSIVQDYN